MDDISALIGPSSTDLIDTFGLAVVQRALELAKGQPPQANLMPYINRALDEARAVQPTENQS